MQRLKDNANKLGIALSDRMLEQFQTYEELLLQWNERMNLTAITDHQEVLDKHFLDSLYLLTYLQRKERATVIDVGTGAGFPGIPLKIARPDVSLTLLDSLQKRVDFLSEVSRCLEQDNRCVHGRAEEACRDEVYREFFDVATARAVASLPVLCELCLPFVKVGGVFCAMKGSAAKEELEEAKGAIEVLGGEISALNPYKLPGGEKRNIIILRKIDHTPPKYPRIYGKIKKSPL